MHKGLKKIFKEDQIDRRGNLPSSKIIKRDFLRKQKVEKLLRSNNLKTGQDYYYAAMILHHSGKKKYTRKAIQLLEKSIDLGYKKARWLYAAAFDRLLLLQGRKQRFGTQFKKEKNGLWKLYPVDNKTTDRDRITYNVPPMNKIKEQLKKWNSH
ncbi:MAG: hypothetical protein Q8R26_01180 [bacterium]|nr:hypothetical protein [bacterium]